MNTKTIKHSLKDPTRDPKLRKILQLATFDQWLKARGEKIEERDGTLVLVKKDGSTHVIFPKESKKETSLTLDILHRFCGPENQ